MMIRVLRATRAVALFFVFALRATEPVAATFQVDPIRIEFGPATTTAAVTLRNAGDESVVVQAQVLAWSQRDGTDHYERTDDMLLSPPIVTIPARGTQIVRVAQRERGPSVREAAYRLFLQEVPGPPKPGFQGLQVALRIGIPIFVRPATAQLRARWTAQARPDGWNVELANQGNFHLQVLGLVLADARGEALTEDSAGPGYVLPGQSRTWELRARASLPAGLVPVRVRAMTDAGPIEADVVVTTRP